MGKRRALVLALLLAAASCSRLYAQTLGSGIFWDYPKVFVGAPAGYFQAASNGGRVTIAWQEAVTTGEGEGRSTLSL